MAISSSQGEILQNVSPNTLIFENTLSAPVTSMAISGLSAKIAGGYIIEITGQNSSAVSNVYMYVNGDNTAANYNSQWHLSNNAVMSSALNNDSFIGMLSAPGYASKITNTVNISSAGKVTWVSNAIATDNSSYYNISTAGLYAVISPDIFSITLSVLTGFFDTGTTFRVYTEKPISSILNAQVMNSWTNMGAWSSATVYPTNAAVTYNGSYWLCKLGNTNNAPVEGTFWTLISAKGDIGTGVSTSITQANHGFIVGNLVRNNGTAYVLSQADVQTNSDVYGMVISVTDANTFVLATAGAYVTGLSGLTAGTEYFLSPTSAGTMTTINPNAIGQVSKMIFLADSTSSGILVSAVGTVVVETTGITPNFGVSIALQSRNYFL